MFDHTRQDSWIAQVSGKKWIGIGIGIELCWDWELDNYPEVNTYVLMKGVDMRLSEHTT